MKTRTFLPIFVFLYGFYYAQEAPPAHGYILEHISKESKFTAAGLTGDMRAYNRVYLNHSTGNWEIINKGNDLAEWVSASSSIPGIFNAMKINNMVYVDGGLLNNLPAQPLRDVCDVIIGSNVICLEEAKKQLKPRDTLLRSVRVLQHQNSAPGKELCDFLIEPAAISKYNEFSFDAYQSIYQYGYRTTSQFISKNPDILKLKKNSK